MEIDFSVLLCCFRADTVDSVTGSCKVCEIVRSWNGLSPRVVVLVHDIVGIITHVFKIERTIMWKSTEFMEVRLRSASFKPRIVTGQLIKWSRSA